MKHAGGIILLFVLLGCVNSNPPPEEQNPSLHEHGLFEKYATNHNQSLTEATTFFKNHYLLESEQAIYEKLPTPPTDFTQWNEKWKKGNTEELSLVPSTVYLQPEFYPTFETKGITMWTDAEPTASQRIGIASTPAEQEATLPTDSNAFQTILFVGSAWGSTHAQAIGLAAQIEPETDIHVNINPQNIIIGPNFPQFSDDWMQRITIAGELGETVKEGTYIVRIIGINPTLDSSMNIEKYPQLVNGNSIFVNTKGLATIIIHVPDKN